MIEDKARPRLWYVGRLGVSLFCLLGLMIFGGWFEYRIIAASAHRFADGILIFLIQSIGAILIERYLALSTLDRGWRLRLAFILPFLVFFLGGTFFYNELSWKIPLGWYLMALLGVSAGALLSTGFSMPLWENNYPPSQQVVDEVFQRHRVEIGEPAPNPPGKRAFDVSLAFFGLIFSSPLWLLISLLLWLEDPGPIFFVKNSVGKGGRNFHQYKFRTMVAGAESDTGPILASEGDERVLFSGRLLRKTALDELPQLINILKGEMSFVGPRPQRTVLVRDYLDEIPSYAERHLVLPGLAGLAQVAGDYYLTPRQKLRFDRLYVRYASLGFDIKLLCLGFLIAFWYRWKPGWNGRLPRRLLHGRK